MIVDNIQQGWQCPKCKRIYSPYQPNCIYCGYYDEIKNTVLTEDELNDIWNGLGGLNGKNCKEEK